VRFVEHGFLILDTCVPVGSGDLHSRSSRSVDLLDRSGAVQIASVSRARRRGGHARPSRARPPQRCPPKPLRNQRLSRRLTYGAPGQCTRSAPDSRRSERFPRCDVRRAGPATQRTSPHGGRARRAVSHRLPPLLRIASAQSPRIRCTDCDVVASQRRPAGPDVWVCAHEVPSPRSTQRDHGPRV
jgi:hypothetical protein